MKTQPIHTASANGSSSQAMPQRAANLLYVLLDRKAKECRCPSCQAVIYSRRFPTCRECSAELPRAIRMNHAERNKLASDAANSRARTRNDAAMSSTWRLSF